MQVFQSSDFLGWILYKCEDAVEIEGLLWDAFLGPHGVRKKALAGYQLLISEKVFNDSVDDDYETEQDDARCYVIYMTGDFLFKHVHVQIRRQRNKTLGFIRN